ncbi:sugar phosphate isomerase/epimerase [Bacillus sp. 31A1R]|uniref:Sugar phosphate isomerase/epimerase n=1 Tax=Robertmurraya mangrovi TaxID=3098077 RepID=A0ABU5J4Y4_9BACI|nr:sugar phosphate isomerase/epimerase [Bacillus sp. 31A1R]MDZ5474468.1 sugar phosphate isomerase/epimerase [Bacillus sp. 31A1R]
MRRLQMGMWYQFSEKDWDLYHHELINGLEISQYEDRDELERVALFCSNKNIQFGIHTPVFGKDKTIPEVTSLDDDVYSKAIKSVEEQVAIASEYGADYLLLHYPFPPIYSPVVDRRYWNGPPPHAYYYSEKIGGHNFTYISERLFQDIANLQNKHNQRIVLEYDFFGEYEEIFNQMFKEYPDIGLVIDTQRMEHNKRTFPDFNPYAWLDQIYKYVYLVHYSNVRFGEETQRHLPVLPSHEELENYGNSLSYLSYIAKKNNTFHVTFEHNPKAVSREELVDCYEVAHSVLKSVNAPV